MKCRRVTRYHCDHCAKGHWKRADAREHEVLCLFAPERDCPTCGQTQIVAEDLALVPQDEHEDDTYPGWTNRVSIKRDGCPKCILAAVYQMARREKMKRYHSGIDGFGMDVFGFDYEATRLAFAEKRIKDDLVDKNPPF